MLFVCRGSKFFKNKTKKQHNNILTFLLNTRGAHKAKKFEQKISSKIAKKIKGFTALEVQCIRLALKMEGLNVVIARALT